MIEVIGGFDQQFYPAYYEDPDLCFRARELGLSVVYVPTAIAWHAENSTIERMSYQHFMVHHANRLRFISKWLPYDAWVCDFLPAERAFLMTLNGAEERRALADAYVAISYEQVTEECRTMLGELAAVANVSCDVNSEESISTGLETHLWPPTDFLKARNLRL